MMSRFATPISYHVYAVLDANTSPKLTAIEWAGIAEELTTSHPTWREIHVSAGDEPNQRISLHKFSLTGRYCVIRFDIAQKNESRVMGVFNAQGAGRGVADPLANKIRGVLGGEFKDAAQAQGFTKNLFDVPVVFVDSDYDAARGEIRAWLDANAVDWYEET